MLTERKQTVFNGMLTECKHIVFNTQTIHTPISICVHALVQNIENPNWDQKWTKNKR